MSGGTRASLAGALVEPAFAWREGALRTERGAARVRSFEAAGRERAAVSVGSSEHFTLPRTHPTLREVNAYLGWFGSASRAMQAFSAINSGVTRVPGVKAGLERMIGRFVHGSTGGPDEHERAGSGSAIVAIAYDAGGRELARVELAGVNGYDFTGRIFAWAAAQAAAVGTRRAGALGPAEAFGLDELEAGAAEAGIARREAVVG